MSERRRIFGEKIIDLGNFTVVALIFGQLLAEEINLNVFVLAVFLVAFFWIIGYILLRKERRKK